MRFFGRYLNRSSLGPLIWSTTVTLTRMSLTVGVPTRISSSSAMSRTRSKSNFLPVSMGRRSTSMVRPSMARYCLPPLSIIANLILFSSHSLHRVHAELLHSSPVNGEAGISTRSVSTNNYPRIRPLGQKRTVLYMEGEDVSTAVYKSSVKIFHTGSPILNRSTIVLQPIILYLIPYTYPYDRLYSSARNQPQPVSAPN